MTAPLPERIPHFQRRPALVVLVAVSSGIAVGSTTDSFSHLPLASGIILAAAICSSLVFRKHAQAVFFSTLLGCLAFGIFLVSVSLERERSSVLGRFADSETGSITLTGTIENIGESQSPSIKLQCERLSTGTETIGTDQTAGIFLWADDTSAHTPFRRGDRIKVTGDLATITGQRNPYAFDYGQYLRRNEGIAALLYCDSYRNIELIAHGAPTLWSKVSDLFASIRNHIRATLSEVIDDSLVRGFMLAMLLGERSSLSDRIWEDFRQAGLSHLLVVSGFNLAIVAWTLYLLLRLLRLGRRELRIAAVMAGTLFYGALIGPQASVIRAVIVVELILASRLLERKPDIANVTAGAALVDLVLNPTDLFNVSFQLSYGAVFALTLIAPALDRYFFPDKGNVQPARSQMILRGMVGTASVLLGTFPIVLFHFHQVSLISILTNLVTIPIASLATMLSVILIPLALVSGVLAGLYADALSAMVYAMSAIAGFAKQIPLAVLRLPHPSAIFLGLYAIALLYIMRPARRSVALARTIMVGIILFTVSSTGIGLTSTILKEDMLSVVFFDVGQGDAALVSTPNGKHYLLDCGGITYAGSAVAERAIYPLLDAEQHDDIDAAFMTHMHLDHFGGFPSLLSHRRVDTIYPCGGRSVVPEARSLDSVVMAKHIPVVPLGRGDIVKLDNDVKFYILSPDKDEADGLVSNERSLVAKLVYKNTSVLFLADISARTEQELASRYGAFLASDIVKVAHHGSRTSSSEQLIAQTGPQFAIFSSGRHNRHGHPHPEVVRRWSNSGAQICRTDTEGALLFRSDGQAFTRESWR